MQKIISRRSTLAASALALLGACASIPSAPSILALPGSNRTFESFRADDQDCRLYASRQITVPVADPGVQSAVAGTAIGAAAGAVIGVSRARRSGPGPVCWWGARSVQNPIRLTPTGRSDSTTTPTFSACTGVGTRFRCRRNSRAISRSRPLPHRRARTIRLRRRPCRRPITCRHADIRRICSQLRIALATATPLRIAPSRVAG